jgi:hypothetical protein
MPSEWFSIGLLFYFDSRNAQEISFDFWWIMMLHKPYGCAVVLCSQSFDFEIQLLFNIHGPSRHLRPMRSDLASLVL